MPTKETSSSILGGWVPEKGKKGVFTTGRQPQDFTTTDFNQFAEASRARWDLGGYLKVKVAQIKEKIAPASH